MIIINNNPQNFKAIDGEYFIHLHYQDGVSTNHPRKDEITQYYTNGIKNDVHENIQAIQNILTPPTKKRRK